MNLKKSVALWQAVEENRRVALQTQQAQLLHAQERLREQQETARALQGAMRPAVKSLPQPVQGEHYFGGRQFYPMSEVVYRERTREVEVMDPGRIARRMASDPLFAQEIAKAIPVEAAPVKESAPRIVLDGGRKLKLEGEG